MNAIRRTPSKPEHLDTEQVIRERETPEYSTAETISQNILPEVLKEMFLSVNQTLAPPLPHLSRCHTRLWTDWTEFLFLLN